MPTVPRRPVAQRERGRLQARRLPAGGWLAAGVRQAEVARQRGVSAQAVSVRHAASRPPVLVSVQLEKVSMAAALCYGVRGGGAQLAFHVTAGSYDTTPLAEVIDQADQGIQRVRSTPQLADSFLRQAGLSVA
jgi:hypothetical protein